MTDQKLSLGQKLVGISFNPSGSSEVNEAKELCAQLIDLLNRPIPELRDPEPSKEYMLLYNKALQDVVAAQMMVVKVLTFKD